jgi:hypothetical protein
MKSISTFLAALLICTVIVAPVMAQGHPVSPTPRVNKNNLCTRVEASVTRLQERIEQNKNTHVNRYTRIIDTIEALNTRLLERGYSTDNLPAQITVMRGYITGFQNDYAEFLGATQQAQELACDENADPVLYKNQLKEARLQLQEMRQKAQELFHYVKNDIKQTLMRIRLQFRANGVTNDVEDSEQSEGDTD